MNGLLLALLLAADAPTVTRIEPNTHLTVQGPATCLNDEAAKDAANRLNAAEARPGWPAVVLAGSAGLVVGAVVAGLVVAYSKR